MLSVDQEEGIHQGFGGTASSKIPGLPIIVVALGDGIGSDPIHIQFPYPVRAYWGRVPSRMAIPRLVTAPVLMGRRGGTILLCIRV